MGAESKPAGYYPRRPDGNSVADTASVVWRGSRGAVVSSGYPSGVILPIQQLDAPAAIANGIAAAMARVYVWIGVDMETGRVAIGSQEDAIRCARGEPRAGDRRMQHEAPEVSP